MKTKGMFKIIATILIGVSAIGLSSCGEKSETITCTYDGEKFDWNDVKSANTYDVKVTDGSIENQKVQLTSSEYEYSVEDDTAEIDISAKNSSGEEIYNSAVPFKFTSLSEFETPSYDHGIISWNAVSSATKYLVKIGNVVKNTTNTYFELDPGINNDVCVKPVLDVSKVTDGKYYTYSVPRTYEIMQTPTFSSFDKDSKTLTWNSIRNAGGYYFRAELNGAVVSEQGGIGGDSTYYNGYSYTEAGVYTVKVAATKNNNANSYDSKYAEKKIIRLAAPKNLITEDADGAIVLKWDSVEYANKYKVVLPNGNSAETTELYYKYIPESKSVEANYSFKVYAMSTELYTLDSLEYAAQDVVKLGMVNNIKIQGQMITWDTVDKAQGYTVSVDGTEVNIDKNEYAFDGYTGSHKVKVKANGNGSTIISSDYSEIQDIYKLSQPKNIRISNGVLTWDPVTNSSSYKIILVNGSSDSNGGSYTATTNSFTINRTDLQESQAIQVQAIGDGLTIADSFLSEPYETYVLSAPIVSVSEEGIVWSKINNASSYTVKIGDYKKNVTGTALNISEQDIPADVYTVTVIANGDLIHYFDSDESEAITMKLLASPEVKENDELTGVSWETVISAHDYQVRIDSGMIENVGSATRNYDIIFRTSGTHTVSVRAVGDGVQTVTSGWTTIQVEVNQLGTPTGFTVAKDGQKLIITSNEVENANGYKFRIGGTVYDSSTNIYEFTVNNPGDFVISVAASGTGYKYIDSTYSVEKTVTVLNTPSQASFTKEDYQTYTLSWSAVNKAVSYTVEVTIAYIDGTTKTNNVTVSKTELQIDTTNVATISAKIIVNGNNSTTYGSTTKEVDTVAVK